MPADPEIVIVGAGIGGASLATVLARQGLAVAVLERDARPVDRVRGEYMQPWGVAEAAKLDLLEILRKQAGGFHVHWYAGYDETVTPEQAKAPPRDLRAAHSVGTGSLCAGHPAMCEALGAAARANGATVFRGINKLQVSAGEPPAIAFEHDGQAISWRPRLIIGADRIAAGEPVGPLHSYSNEDHWVERPIAPGVVLIGDAAGHNDPLMGQGLSIALRDVRIVQEIIQAGDWRPAAFERYVTERSERMRRLRITARLLATLRVEFGPAAAARRARTMRRVREEGRLAPFAVSFAGPETVPAEAFEPATIQALLADE